jgi:hypothetical protein
MRNWVRLDMSGLGPDMSGQSHWNPAIGLHKAERPDMSGLGAGHV